MEVSRLTRPPVVLEAPASSALFTGPSEPSLDGLIAVAGALRTGPDLEPALTALAASVAASLEGATVSINLYRPAFNDYEVRVVHGDQAVRAALLGVSTPAEQ